jgi:hypothetical protein
MSRNRRGPKTATQRWHAVILPLSARLFAPIFTLLTPTRFRCSTPMLPTLRDGTDPLLGGHRPSHYVGSCAEGGVR